MWSLLVLQNCFILTSCNNYETFWRSMWNDDFTDKTRQQSAIWLVLEPLTEQEGLARVCFLSSPASTEWPRSPWRMRTEMRHREPWGLSLLPTWEDHEQSCLGSFRQCWPLSHVPLLLPPQLNMAYHTSLDVALVLRIYSAASHAHGHSWDLLPRALDLARPCCHCFSFIASAFPPGFAIASGADVAVQAPSNRHGAGISANQLLSTALIYPWGTSPEHWQAIPVKMQSVLALMGQVRAMAKAQRQYYSYVLYRLILTKLSVKHGTTWPLY